MAKCVCGTRGATDCAHICEVKKRGYVGAAHVKVYRSEQNFECEKCGEKVGKADYVCYPKAL